LPDIDKVGVNFIPIFLPKRQGSYYLWQSYKIISHEVTKLERNSWGSIKKTNHQNYPTIIGSS